MTRKQLTVVLLLVAIIAGSITAWLLYKPEGKHDKAALALFDKLYHTKYRIRESEKLKMKFKTSNKIADQLYALNNVQLQSAYLSQKLKIKQLSVTRLDHENEFPHFFTLKITGLRLTPKTLPNGLLYLPFLQLQIKKVLIDGTIKLDYQPSSKVFVLAINMKFRKLFTIDYHISLSHFSPELLAMVYASSKRDIDQLEQHIDQAYLVSSKAKLTNNGFFKRMFKAMSPAMANVLKKSLANKLRKAPHALAQQGLQALIDFMQHQKSISMTISPTTPMNLQKFVVASDREKRKLMNANISAEK